MENSNSFIPWKTFETGTFLRVDNVDELIPNNKTATTAAISILESIIAAAPEKRKIQIVKISVYDLNFFKGAFHKNLRDAIQKIGMKFCPEETIFELIFHQDLPNVRIPTANNFIFTIEKGGKYIDAKDACDDSFYEATDVLILELPLPNSIATK